MKRQFEKASLDLLTVVCRFSRLCCPAGEPATRLSRESRQMQVKEAILVIKGEWLTWSPSHCFTCSCWSAGGKLLSGSSPGAHSGSVVWVPPAQVGESALSRSFSRLEGRLPIVRARECNFTLPLKQTLCCRTGTLFNPEIMVGSSGRRWWAGHQVCLTRSRSTGFQAPWLPQNRCGQSQSHLLITNRKMLCHVWNPDSWSFWKVPYHVWKVHHQDFLLKVRQGYWLARKHKGGKNLSANWNSPELFHRVTSRTT